MIEMHAISLIMALGDAAIIGFFAGMIVGNMGKK